MKKLLALVLALTMLVAVFAACGEKDTPTSFHNRSDHHNRKIN